MREGGCMSCRESHELKDSVHIGSGHSASDRAGLLLCARRRFGATVPEAAHYLVARSSAA